MGSVIARILYPDVGLPRVKLSDQTSISSSPDHNSFDTAIHKIPPILATLKSLNRCDWATMETYKLLCFLKSLTATSLTVDSSQRNMWIDSLIKEGLPVILTKCWCDLYSSRIFSKSSEDYLRNFRIVVSLGWSCSEYSEPFCVTFVHEGIISVVLSTLNSDQLSLRKLETSNSHISRLYVAHAAWSILHYVLYNFPESRTEFRKQNGTKLCYRFADSSLDIIKCKSLICLIYGGTDTDRNKAFDIKKISYLLKILNDCLSQENHIGKWYPFGAFELLEALNLLCNNDNIKRLLIKCSLVDTYFKVLSDPVNPDELVASIGGLWILAFDTQFADTLRAQFWFMKRLKQMETHEYQTVAKYSSCIVWLLSDFVANETPKINNSGPEFILISYHWRNKTFATKIKDELIKVGYNAYMDEQKKRVSDVRQMTKTVEEAEIVLICATENYKLCPDCRMEAEYAYRLNKELISVSLEAKYLPEGWHKRLISRKPIFDISSKKESLAQTLRPVLEVIGTRARHRKVTFVSPEVSPVRSKESTSTIINNDVKAIKSWTKLDVEHWLEKSELSNAKKLFSDFDGEVLIGLQKMFLRAPAIYYKNLQQTMGLDIVSLLKFTNALEQLHQ